MKILSLIASSTEIVYALGCGDKLIGRSHECDYPLEVLSLPYCTKPRFNVNGTSREIDDRVKSTLNSALSVYKVDQLKLAKLNPDIIITQSQCEVCAVSLKDVESAVGKITGKSPMIVSLEPNSLSDIWNDIKTVSKAIDVEDRGEKLIQKLKNRITILNEKVRGESLKSVACIEWIDPLMSAGNWVPELVKLAGGKNLFGEAGKHSPWMSLGELCEADPDIIVVMPCGYDIKKTRQEMNILIKKSNWRSLQAFKSNHIYLTDGNQYFNRPGPRIIDSLEILIEIIYGRKFSFGHFRKSWENYNRSIY